MQVKCILKSRVPFKNYTYTSEPIPCEPTRPAVGNLLGKLCRKFLCHDITIMDESGKTLATAKWSERRQAFTEDMYWYDK